MIWDDSDDEPVAGPSCAWPRARESVLTKLRRWVQTMRLLFFGLVMITSSAAAQMPGRSGLASEVACRAGEPYVASEDSIGAAAYGISRDETLLHEAAHVKQLAGACEATLHRWALDPIARLEAEVEATCIGLTIYPPAWQKRRRYAAERVLFDLYARLIPTSAGPPFGVIHAAFERWC
jgi:hypothetical protein